MLMAIFIYFVILLLIVLDARVKWIINEYACIKVCIAAEEEEEYLFPQ